MKGGYGKTKILNQEFKDIPEEKVQNIRSKLIEEGLSNKEITYEEFLKLYEPYRAEISEVIFAEILGIGFDSFGRMKNNHVTPKILRKRFKIITSERKEMIKNEIIQKGFQNEEITYEEFLKLYEAYSEEISEVTFAEILGISYGSHNRMKNYNSKTIILNSNNVDISNERKRKIKEELIEKGLSRQKNHI